MSCKKNLCRLSSLFALACFTTLGAVAQSSTPRRITQTIDETKLVALRGHVIPVATAANDLGPVADSFDLDHMQLVLQRSAEQEQALNQLMDEQTDPTSPNFHHWLTAKEFGKQFGVAKADIDTLTSWLESHGFRVNKVYANRMLIDFSGTAGQLQDVFHTPIHQIAINGEAHIANISDPQIPAALTPVVTGIASLNDIKPKPMHEPVAQYTFGGCSDASPKLTEPGTCYAITPQDTQAIYNLTPLYNIGISGQGQTIYVVEDTDVYNFPGDWNTYRSTFGLSGYSGSFTQLHPLSCTDPGATADDGEAALDVEMATSVAPSAAIDLISCPSGTFTFGGQIALQNLINETSPAATAGVVSVSYGICEAFNGAGGNAAFYNTYEQAAAQGFSVFVASGDEGPSSCSALFASSGTPLAYDVASLGVTGWGETPYNVSVGGTDFEDTYNVKEAGASFSTYWNSTNTSGYGSALKYIPEIPWNDSCASVLTSDVLTGSFTTYGTGGTCNNATYDTSSGYLSTGAASGGASNCATGAGGTDQSSDALSDPMCQGYAKPSWQSAYGVPTDGLRDIPDVSMFASNGVWGHYEVICWSDPAYTSDGSASCSGAPSTWTGFGGTSVATPAMAGIQALVNQRTGETWGNPNSIYYQLAQTEYGIQGGTFEGASCNSSASGGPASTCVFNDITQGDIDLECEDNGTTEEAHCYKPSGTYGVDSTDTITGATIINGGTGYTTAPTCTIAGPTNNSSYKTPTGTTLWSGGAQAACTATRAAGTTTAKWTITISTNPTSTTTGVWQSGVGGVTVGGTTYTFFSSLTGVTTANAVLYYTSSTTATGEDDTAKNLEAAINDSSGECAASPCFANVTAANASATATYATNVVTLTAKTAGYAGNFNVTWANSFMFGAGFIQITNSTKGQGPNYVSAITITADGSGYQPETPITLTGGGGSGAIAVANTTVGTAAESYQPAYGAANGYDLATGLGSPNAYNLVLASAWCTPTTVCGQAINWNQQGPFTYGQSPVALTATSDSGLAVTYTVHSGPGTISGSTLTITGAGNIVIYANQAGNTSFHAAPQAQQTIVVNKASLTITASSPAVTYGSAVPTITPSYSGFQNGDTGSVLTTQPTCTTTYTVTSNAGSAPSTSCSGAAATNYTFPHQRLGDREPGFGDHHGFQPHGDLRLGGSHHHGQLRRLPERAEQLGADHAADLHYGVHGDQQRGHDALDKLLRRCRHELHLYLHQRLGDREPGFGGHHGLQPHGDLRLGGSHHHGQLQRLPERAEQLGVDHAADLHYGVHGDQQRGLGALDKLLRRCRHELHLYLHQRLGDREPGFGDHRGFQPHGDLRGGSSHHHAQLQRLCGQRYGGQPDHRADLHHGVHGRQPRRHHARDQLLGSGRSELHLDLRQRLSDGKPGHGYHQCHPLQRDL